METIHKTVRIKATASKIWASLTEPRLMKKWVIDENEGTTLTFTQSGFPTEVIYLHFNFYWNTALDKIRRLNEDQ